MQLQILRKYNMASIQKIQRAKGVVYKVTIRQNGSSTISKTFPTKKTAV